MADPVFRLVADPAALRDIAPGGARERPADGELALLPGDGGLEDVSRVAHALGVVSVSLLRAEASAAEQERTVIAWAGAMGLVWVGAGFSDDTRAWARDRGPMTLLVESTGPLPEGEQRRGARARCAATGRPARTTARSRCPSPTPPSPRSAART